jgi:putative ABC transport system permease protein
LCLAAEGIYGVMSYTVSRRTHEIGVRVALGAGSRDVISLVLEQGLKVTVPGILLGLAGALAATRGIGELLSPSDPPTFSIVSLLLTVIALAACYFPARRAMHVDSVRALRNE